MLPLIDYLVGHDILLQDWGDVFEVLSREVRARRRGSFLVFLALVERLVLGAF